MDVFSVLADPVRRSLLEQLAGEGACRVVDLTAGRGISRPAVSRHLRLLGEAGLVRVDDVGRERHYRLEPSPLQQVEAYAQRLRAGAAGPPIAAHDLDALDLEVRRTVRERRDGEPRHTPSVPDTDDAVIDTTTTEETA